MLPFEYLGEGISLIATPSTYNPAITLESVLGAERAAKVKTQRWFGEGFSDLAASNGYSIVVGSGLDLIASHLEPTGWLAARVQSILWNTATGALYGRYRDAVFRWTNTTPESSKIKKIAVELGAFNVFQIPSYAVMVMVSTAFFEGGVNWEKVQNGTLGVVALSPFIGPTFNWTYDRTREFFGLPTSAEKAATSSAARSASPPS